MLPSTPYNFVVFNNQPITSLRTESAVFDFGAFSVLSIIALTSGELLVQLHLEVSNDGATFVDLGEVAHGVGNAPNLSGFGPLVVKYIRIVALQDELLVGTLTAYTFLGKI